MKVGMLIRDTEYRDAMIEMMSGYDKDIMIEVAGPSGVSSGSVILTDILPNEIETKSLEKIRKRTVFLSPVPVQSGHDKTDKPRPVFRDRASEESIHILFKYSSLDTILAELSLVYSLWSGNAGNMSPSTRVIAVTGESDILSSSRCRSLAGQILYRHGGSVLILPLGYINDYRAEMGFDDRGWFRRLMYMIDEGLDYPADAFTFSDSYGIRYLKLPDGINPVTALAGDYLERLVSSIGSHFATLILDIGSCYREENLGILRYADNILFFGGRRITDIDAYIGEKNSGKVKRIGTTDTGVETLSIDDFVSEVYGREETRKRNE